LNYRLEIIHVIYLTRHILLHPVFCFGR